MTRPTLRLVIWEVSLFLVYHSYVNNNRKAEPNGGIQW